MTEKKDAAIVLAQSRQVISAQDLLRTPVEELDDSGKATAWSVLDLLSKKVIKGRTVELRDALLERAKEVGEEGVSAGKQPKFTAKMGGAKVTNTQIAGKVTIDEAALKMVLAEKGIPHGKVFVERTVVELNEKALEGLIAAELLTDEDVEQFTSVAAPTHRLTVTKAKEVLALLPKGE